VPQTVPRPLPTGSRQEGVNVAGADGVGTGKKNGSKMPEPLHRAECCSSYIWSGPRRHLLEMPPYALLLHTVPAHTPNGIPRTESRGTSARSTCATGSRAHLPGVCFRVVRDQELRSARELAEAHVPRPVLNHPCLRCVHYLRRCRRRLRPEPRPPHRALSPRSESHTSRSSCSGGCGCTPCSRAQALRR
jgi:hypothetical protein